jgi:hypothetical protein
MLIYSMSVSVDGFITDSEGCFEWTAPGKELFRFHLAQVGDIRSSSAAARRSCRRSSKTSRWT